mgnify:FL=1
MACDHSGEYLLVGDQVGNVHMWKLIDNEPKLSSVKESILENDISSIVSINQEEFVLTNGHNQVKFWNVKYDTFEEIRTPDKYGSIQSICSFQHRLILGTKMNYIISKDIYQDDFNILMRVIKAHTHSMP